MSVFRAAYRRGRDLPLRQRAVYRVVNGPRPRPWRGSLLDLAVTADLTPRDAREGLLGLMKRECIHVSGIEDSLVIAVLKPLPRFA